MKGGRRAKRSASPSVCLVSEAFIRTMDQAMQAGVAPSRQFFVATMKRVVRAVGGDGQTVEECLAQLEAIDPWFGKNRAALTIILRENYQVPDRIDRPNPGPAPAERPRKKRAFVQGDEEPADEKPMPATLLQDDSRPAIFAVLDTKVPPYGGPAFSPGDVFRVEAVDTVDGYPRMILRRAVFADAGVQGTWLGIDRSGNPEFPANQPKPFADIQEAADKIIAAAEAGYGAIEPGAVAEIGERVYTSRDYVAPRIAGRVTFTREQIEASRNLVPGRAWAAAYRAETAPMIADLKPPLPELPTLPREEAAAILADPGVLREMSRALGRELTAEDMTEPVVRATIADILELRKAAREMRPSAPGLAERIKNAFRSYKFARDEQWKRATDDFAGRS